MDFLEEMMLDPAEIVGFNVQMKIDLTAIMSFPVKMKKHNVRRTWRRGSQAYTCRMGSNDCLYPAPRR